MKRYIKNLLIAVCGKDPYREELDRVREEMKKAGENVAMLQGSFSIAHEKANNCEQLLNDYKCLLEKSDKQLVSYQRLTDNLRQRIADFQTRIKEYNREIERLQKLIDGKSQESML